MTSAGSAAATKEQTTSYNTADYPTSDPKHRLVNSSEIQDRPSKVAKTQEEEEESMKATKAGVQRYLVAVEYIGTRFCGSQQQLNHRTVAGVLQDAFHKFVGQPVSLFCSSRTDAGVHALSNVCHVDVERISKRKPGEVLQPHEPSVVKKAVNHFLQKEGDIMIIDVRSVSSDFHARYKAQERTVAWLGAHCLKLRWGLFESKVVLFANRNGAVHDLGRTCQQSRYYYRLLTGPELLSAFERDRAWHVPEELNLHAMQEACKVLVGQHDFSSFRAAGCQAKSPVRALDELQVYEYGYSPSFPYLPERETRSVGAQDSFACLGDPENDKTSITSDFNKQDCSQSCQKFGVRRGHRCLVVKARARSFLYHQVRLLVGVLKCVGTGHLTVADVQRILEAKSVTAASPMAPSCGLYLGQVKYDLD